MVQAVISGTGLMVPRDSISNEALVESFNQYVAHYNAEHAQAIKEGTVAPKEMSSAAFIEKASGIKSRYTLDKASILDPAKMRPSFAAVERGGRSQQAAMAIEAAQGAMDRAQKVGSDIDLVIMACSNTERPYPAVAIEVQEALGARGYAFDMNVACSSATFAINLAHHMIQNGGASCALIVNPEICCGHLNFRDRDSHFIFGDVCTAVICEREDTVAARTGFRIESTQLKTQYSTQIWNGSGFLDRYRPPVSEEAALFQQNGRQVFKEVVPMASEHILAHLAAANLQPADIARFWLHQANLNMNQLIAKKILGDDSSPERAPVILDRFANTASAGSIIAFHETSDDLPQGAKGLICSFGAGYSIGSLLVTKLSSHAQ